MAEYEDPMMRILIERSNIKFETRYKAGDRGFDHADPYFPTPLPQYLPDQTRVTAALQFAQEIISGVDCVNAEPQEVLIGVPTRRVA